MIGVEIGFDTSFCDILGKSWYSLSESSSNSGLLLKLFLFYCSWFRLLGDWNPSISPDMLFAVKYLSSDVSWLLFDTLLFGYTGGI